MWRESEAEDRLADGRVTEARATGAPVLATACPFCVTCFSGSQSAGSLEIVDVAEMVARAVGVSGA